MQKQDSKATQLGAWARHANMPAAMCIPFIMGQIDELIGVLQSFNTSNTEYLSDMKLLMERLLQRLDGIGSTAEILTAQPEQERSVCSRRRTVHISELVLGEGDWLMTTVEACAEMGISRGTLISHRDQGLLTEVRIGKKKGGVRFISREVAQLREWYSVRKGKV